MFQWAVSFNQPIGGWDVSRVVDMFFMFQNAGRFNQPIGGWDVSNVASMESMFAGAEAFNQPIGGWDVSNVASMESMFAGAEAFNQPIGGWDVFRVENMSGMFAGAEEFNQPIGDWDVFRVENMSGMFAGAEAFNQPIGNWKVSPIADVSHMFEGALAFKGTKSVNQPICGDKSLFQTGFADNVTEYLDNWRPLECSVSKPANCGPTALKFVLPALPREPFQALSDAVQTSGIKFADFNQFFYDKVRHLDLHYTTLKTDDILPNLLNIFRTNLLPGYATLIRLADPVVKGRMNHITTIVRLDQLILFEGQYNKKIAEDAIVDHVRGFRTICLWCNKHKNKHRLDEEESQPQPQPPQPRSFKKQHQGGKTTRKKRPVARRSHVNAR
jgi:surface protein